MEVYFLISQTDGKSKKFKLKEGEYVILGRSKKLSQVILDGDGCSSKHCKVSLIKDKVLIEDLDSKNGIFLNELRVQTQQLFLKDRLQIASYTIMIDQDRLSPADIATLSYKGKGRDNNRNMPLEIDKAKYDSGFVQSVARRRGPNKKSSPASRDPSHNQRYRKKSNLHKQLSEMIRSFIDITFMFFVFMIGTSLLKIIAPAEYQKASIESNYFLKIFSDELILYTFGVMILTIALQTFLKRSKKGSIGERVFKKH